MKSTKYNPPVILTNFLLPLTKKIEKINFKTNGVNERNFRTIESYNIPSFKMKYAQPLNVGN
jgi:hypothetical protein